MFRSRIITVFVSLCVAGSALAAPPEPLVRFLPPVAQTAAPVQPSVTPAEPIMPGTMVPSAPQQFGLSDLESIALSNNPSLARANARVQAARGNWVQVGLLPNPVGGYSTAEIGEEGTAGQQGGAIGQEIVLGHKLKLNRAVAAQEIRQAEQQREAQTFRVLNDVRTQFFNVLIAQQKVELAQRLFGVGQQGVDTTEKLFKAQEVGRADVLQARIEANTAQILAENARNEYLSAWRHVVGRDWDAESLPCPAGRRRSRWTGEHSVGAST